MCRVGWGDNNSGDSDNNCYELNLIYSYLCRVGWGDNNSGDSDNNYYDSETMSIRHGPLTLTHTFLFSFVT